VPRWSPGFECLLPFSFPVSCRVSVDLSPAVYFLHTCVVCGVVFSRVFRKYTGVIVFTELHVVAFQVPIGRPE